MNKLLQRILTAIVLVAVLLVIFFVLPRAAAIIAIGAFVVAGAWEWAGFFGTHTVAVRLVYAGLVAAMISALTLAAPGAVPSQEILLAGFCWWLLALALVVIFPQRIPVLVTAVCGLLVLIPAWVAILELLRHPDAGAAFVLYALTIVWAADIGAYFFGRRLGRVKLAPRVSPGKTREGAVGGLFAAAIVAVAGAWILGLPLLVMIPIAVSVAAISIVGDLTVSLFKRHAGLKDSGSLFPGHGGVMDRVDSVTAAMPLFVLELVLVGVLEL